LHRSKLPIPVSFSQHILPLLLTPTKFLLLVFSCSLYLVKSRCPPVSSSWSRTVISCHSHSNGYLWVLYSSILFMLLVPSKLWFIGVSCEQKAQIWCYDFHPNYISLVFPIARVFRRDFKVSLDLCSFFQ
jgi:hypothetical protein